MYTQPALLLSVLALAGEVLSTTLGGETAREHHARQSRMHRRRGLPGNDSDNNPCKREPDPSTRDRKGGSFKFKFTDASTGNVTVIPATSYLRQGQGEGAVSDSRQPLDKAAPSDSLSDERLSLQAESSSDDGSSSSSSPDNSWSSTATTSSAAPAATSPTASGGGGMSVVTSWSGDDVSPAEFKHPFQPHSLGSPPTSHMKILQFQSWDFFTYSDPTHGDVNYVSKSDAQSQNLVGNQDGMFKMSVSTGDLVNGKRVSHS